MALVASQVFTSNFEYSCCLSGKLANLGTLALSLDLGRASDDAKLDKFNTGVDSRAMSKAMADKFKCKGSPWWTNSSSTARSHAQDRVEQVQGRHRQSKSYDQGHGELCDLAGLRTLTPRLDLEGAIGGASQVFT